MTIKCLAFDLDGTLLTDQKEIDPRTKKSIQKAMEQGIHIVIASGRDKNGTSFVYEPLGLEQGNIIWLWSTDRSSMILKRKNMIWMMY